jgi:hypothetical protein
VKNLRPAPLLFYPHPPAVALPAIPFEIVAPVTDGK